MHIVITSTLLSLQCGGGIETRQRMDLETHWTMKSRPHIQFTENETERDRQFEKLLELHPALPLKENESETDKGKQYKGYDRTIDVL